MGIEVVACASGDNLNELAAFSALWRRMLDGHVSTFVLEVGDAIWKGCIGICSRTIDLDGHSSSN